VNHLEHLRKVFIPGGDGWIRFLPSARVRVRVQETGPVQGAVPMSRLQGGSDLRPVFPRGRWSRLRFHACGNARVRAAACRFAGDEPGFHAGRTDLQKRVNGALAMLQYCLTPEVTTSSLSINAGEAGVNGLSLYQLGGGFTWSKSSPLYLEGNAAFSQYDPVFIFSRGTVRAEVPVVWKSLVGTAGIGWDFPIAKGARAPADRQPFDRACGERDSRRRRCRRRRDGPGGRIPEARATQRGGYGGSLMLDYEHYREAYEIDVEARLANIWLQSVSGTSGREGDRVVSERESVDPVACSHRASGAGPPGPVRPGVRLLVLFRARRGHGGVQSSQLPRGRARTRHRGLDPLFTRARLMAGIGSGRK